MRKLIAYMITWTTYGTWLQGDERGYVKDGETLGPDKQLKYANQILQKHKSIRFTETQKQIVKNAIIQTAQKNNQRILAISVCSNHIHVVAETASLPIEQTVHKYKRMSTLFLKNAGLNGKIWSKGFDKRFCYTEKEIINRIEYVNKHND